MTKPLVRFPEGPYGRAKGENVLRPRSPWPALVTPPPWYWTRLDHLVQTEQAAQEIEDFLWNSTTKLHPSNSPWKLVNTLERVASNNNSRSSTIATTGTLKRGCEGA
ncbi:hypothetical protein KQX54_019245 [Cotesia glomerata]|uniref:Uncharacterized protein n=1 Tax=Cotesia glomerata TaxID=32391 RepID=A0AAV7IYI1_COTGL|nr:hypothetical protein KQX54_019245 [Cotesia glomerata]